MNVLFDLDGTLTDSRPGIVACLQHVLRELGAQVPAEGVLAGYIGPPLRDTFQVLPQCASADERIDAAIAAYRERFADVGSFEAICGSELDGTRADKRALIGHALATSALDPAASIMIGDRRQDVIGALHNGLFPVGALWGYGSEQELTAAGVKCLYAQPAELEHLVDGGGVS